MLKSRKKEETRKLLEKEEKNFKRAADKSAASEKSSFSLKMRTLKETIRMTNVCFNLK